MRDDECVITNQPTPKWNTTDNLCTYTTTFVPSFIIIQLLSSEALLLPLLLPTDRCVIGCEIVCCMVMIVSCAR